MLTMDGATIKISGKLEGIASMMADLDKLGKKAKELEGYLKQITTQAGKARPGYGPSKQVAESQLLSIYDKEFKLKDKINKQISGIAESYQQAFIKSIDAIKKSHTAMVLSMEKQIKSLQERIAGMWANMKPKTQLESYMRGVGFAGYFTGQQTGSKNVKGDFQGIQAELQSIMAGNGALSGEIWAKVFVSEAMAYMKKHARDILGIGAKMAETDDQIRDRVTRQAIIRAKEKKFLEEAGYIQPKNRLTSFGSLEEGGGLREGWLRLRSSGIFQWISSLRNTILLIIFATQAWVNGIQRSIQAAKEYQSALAGLNSVAAKTGNITSDVKNAAKELTEDGLLTMADAATSLKNLLATGFSLPEAIQLMKGFKDSAAFGRQASLGFGEAIRGATEGLKNNNPLLLDNAGLTKNMSVILKELGLNSDDYARIAEDAGVRTKILGGLMKELSLFTGDADRMTKLYAGSLARVKAENLELNVVIGQALLPAANEFLKIFVEIIKNFKQDFMKDAIAHTSEFVVLFRNLANILKTVLGLISSISTAIPASGGLFTGLGTAYFARHIFGRRKDFTHTSAEYMASILGRDDFEGLHFNENTRKYSGNLKNAILQPGELEKLKQAENSLKGIVRQHAILGGLGVGQIERLKIAFTGLGTVIKGLGKALLSLWPYALMAGIIWGITAIMNKIEETKQKAIRDAEEIKQKALDSINEREVKLNKILEERRALRQGENDLLLEGLKLSIEKGKLENPEKYVLQRTTKKLLDSLPITRGETHAPVSAKFNKQYQDIVTTVGEITSEGASYQGKFVAFTYENINALRDLSTQIRMEAQNPNYHKFADEISNQAEALDQYTQAIRISRQELIDFQLEMTQKINMVGLTGWNARDAEATLEATKKQLEVYKKAGGGQANSSKATEDAASAAGLEAFRVTYKAFMDLKGAEHINEIAKALRDMNHELNTVYLNKYDKELADYIENVKKSDIYTEELVEKQKRLMNLRFWKEVMETNRELHYQSLELQGANPVWIEFLKNMDNGYKLTQAMTIYTAQLNIQQQKQLKTQKDLSESMQNDEINRKFSSQLSLYKSQGMFGLSGMAGMLKSKQDEWWQAYADKSVIGLSDDETQKRIEKFKQVNQQLIEIQTSYKDLSLTIAQDLVNQMNTIFSNLGSTLVDVFQTIPQQVAQATREANAQLREGQLTQQQYNKQIANIEHQQLLAREKAYTQFATSVIFDLGQIILKEYQAALIKKALEGANLTNIGSVLGAIGGVFPPLLLAGLGIAALGAIGGAINGNQSGGNFSAGTEGTNANSARQLSSGIQGQIQNIQILPSITILAEHDVYIGANSIEEFSNITGEHIKGMIQDSILTGEISVKQK